MNYAARFHNAKRIVVKVGTSTLTYETGAINYRQVEKLVGILSDLQSSGREIILVTSAAVSVGTSKLRLSERPKDIPGKQAAAAVGQCELMYMYDRLFTKYHHVVAQLLLTRNIIENTERADHVRNTLGRLISLGAIPIINENDTVAIEELELEIGDNDTLSAIVATLADADALVLMSDIDGLYDGDPRENPDAKIIPLVTEIDDHIRAVAGGAGSAHAKGGMVTKITAASIAMKAGIDMAIINGANMNLLYDLTDGTIRTGTFFCCPERPSTPKEDV